MDFGISLRDSSHLWIEATAPDVGAQDSADRLSAPNNQFLYGVEIKRTTALRILGSIAAKREQFQRAVAAGLVKTCDGLIVAISGAQLPLADLETPDEPPLIAKIVFAIGPTKYSFELGSGKVGPSAPEPQSVIRKASGSEVSARLFLSSDAEEVSALLFDPHHVKNRPETRGLQPAHDFIVVHNPFARIALRPGQLPAGREFFMQLGHVDRRAARKPASRARKPASRRPHQ